MEIFIKDISHIKARTEKRAFAHTLLTDLLSQKVGDKFEIIREKNQKPYLKGNPIYFNMSHSKDMVAIAIAPFEVGIDIEFMKKRNFAALSMYHFKKIINNPIDFYKCWTEFEASVKLYGSSIFKYKNLKPRYLYSEKIDNYMLSAASNNYSTFKISSLDNSATGENI